MDQRTGVARGGSLRHFVRQAAFCPVSGPTPPRGATAAPPARPAT
jgi:hypothetical protein